LAVPDFVALSPDATELARTLGPILWDDFNFEREFYLIPRDTYGSVRAARTIDEIPFTDWRELGADALVFGTVQRSGENVTVQVRLFNVRTRTSVFSKEYTGSTRNPRVFAHTFADEAHEQQRGLRGVARTRLTFASDRDRERIQGPVGTREIKEIWIADYDGANQRRITTSRELNANPSWSPDARAVAYTSWRRHHPRHLRVAHLSGRPREPVERSRAVISCRSTRPTGHASRSSPRGRATWRSS
jgi:TolB protein